MSHRKIFRYIFVAQPIKFNKYLTSMNLEFSFDVLKRQTVEIDELRIQGFFLKDFE